MHQIDYTKFPNSDANQNLIKFMKTVLKVKEANALKIN